MTYFAHSPEVRQLISELRQVFSEPNDLHEPAIFSSDRQGLVRSISRYTAYDVPLLLLDDLGWRLVTTVGTQQTLRHFLPRIFEEALIGDGLGSTDWRAIAGKLPIAEFESWTGDQRQLTLAAMKLWMAKEEIDLVGTGLDAAAILQMPMKDVVGRCDPHHGTDEPLCGTSRYPTDAITFLVEEEDRLSN